METAATHTAADKVFPELREGQMDRLWCSGAVLCLIVGLGGCGGMDPEQEADTEQSSGALVLAPRDAGPPSPQVVRNQPHKGYPSEPPCWNCLRDLPLDQVANPIDQGR